MEETACAKLNLALHVRGREADGYHRIETLFAFCEDGDRLAVAPGDGLSLRVEGPFAGALAGEGGNLVLEAARRLAGWARVGSGAALVLDKRLPVASGIGGGSSDAAAALRLLVRWWGLEVPDGELHRLARSLGADVPACLASTSARGTERGDVLEPADIGLAGTPVLLVNPGVAVSTADVFRRWDGKDGGPLPPDFRDGRNDLEGPARAIAPVIGDVLARLGSAEGATLVRMSGSGATCFALFGNEGDRAAAARAIRRQQPGWWCLESRLK